MSLREEPIADVGLVLSPRKQQAAQQSSALPLPQLFLAIEPDLRAGDLGQDLRIDRGRLNRKPAQDVRDEVGSKVDVVSERAANSLGCFRGQGNPHRRASQM